MPIDKNDAARWRSVTTRGGIVHTQIWLARTFANREEGDAYAIAMGKDLIDDLLA